MKTHYSLILLLLALASNLQAQSFYSIRIDRSLIATVGLNTATYYGDLKDYSDIIDTRPSVSLGLMTAVSRKLFVRSEFSWVYLAGQDQPFYGTGRKNRNLSFYSHNYELNVVGLFNIIPQRGRFYQRPNLNLYGFLGVGGLYFNPKAKLDGQEYALQPLQTEGVDYSRVTFVIPFGLGGRIKLTPFINLALEAGWRKTFTDYLDDVSTVHIDPATVSNPITRRLADRRPEVGEPAVRPGTRRGDPDDKDGYMLISVKLEYYLPVQLGQSRKVYQRKRRAAYR